MSDKNVQPTTSPTASAAGLFCEWTTVLSQGKHKYSSTRSSQRDAESNRFYAPRRPLRSKSPLPLPYSSVLSVTSVLRLRSRLRLALIAVRPAIGHKSTRCQSDDFPFFLISGVKGGERPGHGYHSAVWFGFSLDRKCWRRLTWANRLSWPTAADWILQY